MTALLEKAFKEATALPELEQNRVAEWLIKELASEKKWDHSFAESESLLESLAKDALSENKEGNTLNLNLDEM